jgi:tetratricopeptide (TPR) repeat protein
MRAARSPMMASQWERRPRRAGERMKATNHDSFSSFGRVLALASLLVVWLSSALATTAHADPLAKPTHALAREHLATGNRYYRVREFEKAVEEYKAGAVREDAPVFYYNLGQCYRQLGRYEDAIWHYERFLDRGKPTGTGEASVKRFIAQMRGELEKKAMKQPPVEPAPPPSSVSLGQILPAMLPPAEGRRDMPFQRKLAIGVGTAGAAILGLGVVLGIRAESFEDDADAICPMSTCDRWEDATKLIDRGKTNALYANVALGVGGAAILGAAVLWLTGAPREHKGMVVEPQVSRAFTGVAMSMRF